MTPTQPGFGNSATPTPGGFGASSGGFGQPTMGTMPGNSGFGGPQQNAGFGAPSPNGGFGSPPPQNAGFGSPPPGMGPQNMGGMPPMPYGSMTAQQQAPYDAAKASRAAALGQTLPGMGPQNVGFGAPPPGMGQLRSVNDFGMGQFPPPPPPGMGQLRSVNDFGMGQFPPPPPPGMGPQYQNFLQQQSSNQQNNYGPPPESLNMEYRGPRNQNQMSDMEMMQMRGQMPQNSGSGLYNQKPDLGGDPRMHDMMRQQQQMGTDFSNRPETQAFEKEMQGLSQQADAAYRSGNMDQFNALQSQLRQKGDAFQQTPELMQMRQQQQRMEQMQRQMYGQMGMGGPQGGMLQGIGPRAMQGGMPPGQDQSMVMPVMPPQGPQGFGAPPPVNTAPQPAPAMAPKPAAPAARTPYKKPTISPQQQQRLDEARRNMQAARATPGQSAGLSALASKFR